MHDSGRAHTSLTSAYVATREILRASDADQVRRALIDLCHALGADVVPADADRTDVLPIDLALGEDQPLVPASSDPRVREDVQRYVVPAIADARVALERDLTTGRMQVLATRDPLTGLWNRHSLDLSVDRARPGDCLAMVDLDHFKHVNDNFGHAEGDAVLSAFAGHLMESVRSHDVVGRHGGEEFVVLLPSTHVGEARDTLERIRTSWALIAPFGITFSAGVAGVDDSAGGIPTAGRAALRWADAALYQAKADGRNRVVCAAL